MAKNSVRFEALNSFFAKWIGTPLAEAKFESPYISYFSDKGFVSQRRFKVFTFFEWNCENSSLARISGENKIKNTEG